MTNRNFHFLDFTEAKLASIDTVQAKVRQGWRVHAVTQSFGAAGGVASYEHALVGPAGELMKLSTRTVQAAGVPVAAEPLQLNSEVLLLEGVRKVALVAEAERRGLPPFEVLGAQWNGERRCWMVRPSAAADFAQWLPAGATPVPMFPSLVQG